VKSLPTYQNWPQQTLTSLVQIPYDNVTLPDETLDVDAEEGIIYPTRSLILSQAVMHSAEHKGQIAAIMKRHGHHIDLDALDIWSYVSEMKKS